jgi:hypothetical protein
VAAITRQGVRLDESKTLGPVGSLLRDRIILPGAAFKARMDHADAGGWMYRFTPAT